MRCKTKIRIYAAQSLFKIIKPFRIRSVDAYFLTSSFKLIH